MPTATYTVSADTHISELLAEQGTNYGNDLDIRLAGRQTAGRGGSGWFRSLFRFATTAQVPAAATINSAIITLQTIQPPGVDTPFNVYRTSQPWTETGATWVQYAGGQNWGTLGGDYELTPVLSRVFGKSADPELTIDVTTLYAAAHADAVPLDIICVPTDISITGFNRVAALQAGGGDEPMIEVTYELPPGVAYYDRKITRGIERALI